jgi:hypothetical protein
VWPNPFLSKLIWNLYREKSIPNICATVAFFKKNCPKKTITHLANTSPILSTCSRSTRPFRMKDGFSRKNAKFEKNAKFDHQIAFKMFAAFSFWCLSSHLLSKYSDVQCCRTAHEYFVESFFSRSHQKTCTFFSECRYKYLQIQRNGFIITYRVTRLGECSPDEWSFTLGSFFENCLSNPWAHGLLFLSHG